MVEDLDTMKKDVEDIVESLCFSRLPGSQNAEKAEKIICEKFSQRGILLSRECFEATKFWISTLLQSMMVVAMILTLGMVYFSFYFPIINLIISFVVMFITVLGLSAASGGKELKIIGKKIKTCNFLYEQEPAENRNEKTIIFMAHHDTKGQPLTTVWRSAFFTIGIFGLLIMIVCFSICGVFDLMNLQIPEIINWLGIIGASVVLICCIPLAFNGLNESSFGTLDNASGIAAVYSLAQFFKSNPLKKTKILYLITGAEELAMLGARAFLNKYGNTLNRKTTYIINFDMIGHKNGNVEIMEKEGLLHPKCPSPYLISIAEKAAQDLNIKLSKFTLPIGGATDRGVFTKAGFEGIDFINKKASFQTHSAKDCLDNFDSSLAVQFVMVAKKMASIIDENLNPK